MLTLALILWQVFTSRLLLRPVRLRQLIGLIWTYFYARLYSSFFFIIFFIASLADVLEIYNTSYLLHKLKPFRNVPIR